MFGRKRCDFYCDRCSDNYLLKFRDIAVNLRRRWTRFGHEFFANSIKVCL